MAAVIDCDVYCDDCAECIGLESTTDDCEGCEDCNIYYYDAENEESDCPQHCADCGEFLGNPLTTDGDDYVWNTVREDIARGYTDSVACTIWKDHYDYIDWDGIGECADCNELSINLDDDGYCPGCAD